MESDDNNPKQTGSKAESEPVRAEAKVNTTQLRLLLKVGKQTNVSRVKQAGNNADLMAWWFACRGPQLTEGFYGAGDVCKQMKHLSFILCNSGCSLRDKSQHPGVLCLDIVVFKSHVRLFLVFCFQRKSSSIYPHGISGMAPPPRLECFHSCLCFGRKEESFCSRPMLDDSQQLGGSEQTHIKEESSRKAGRTNKSAVTEMHWVLIRGQTCWSSGVQSALRRKQLLPPPVSTWLTFTTPQTLHFRELRFFSSDAIFSKC